MYGGECFRWTGLGGDLNIVYQYRTSTFLLSEVRDGRCYCSTSPVIALTGRALAASHYARTWKATEMAYRDGYVVVEALSW